MPLLQDRTAVFIARLWRECDETGTARAWRGSVEHVQTGRQRYFLHYDDLVAFLSQVFPDIDIDNDTAAPATAPDHTPSFRPASSDPATAMRVPPDASDRD